MVSTTIGFALCIILCADPIGAQQASPSINKVPSTQQTQNAKTDKTHEDKKISPSIAKTEQKGECNTKQCETEEKSFWNFSLTDSIIAVFTVILAGVSYKQWKELQRTVNSAEKLEAPFLIPELVSVQDMVLDTDSFNGLIPQCTYALRNHGRTPAILTAFQDTVRLIKQLPDTEEELWRGESLESRGGHYIPIGVSHIPIPEGRSGTQFNCRLSDLDLGNLPITNTNRLYLVGRMRYLDLFGTAYIHAFCIQFLRWDRAIVDGSTLPARTWINVAHVTTGDTVYNYRREES